MVQPILLLFNSEVRLNLFKCSFPQRARPLKKNVQYELNKVYPGSKVLYFDASDKDPTKPLLVIDSNKNV